MFEFLGNVLPSAIAIGTVFLLGCVGEIITEKAGHLNLGIPGIMCFGTFGGCLGVSLIISVTSNWFLVVLVALLFALLFGALAGLIYAFLTVTLQSNQNVTGLALTTFGAGMCDYFMNKIDKSKFALASKIIKQVLPFANSNKFTEIFFGHGILVYIAILFAIIAAIIINKTRVGLSLRAVGENPATADAAGINVTVYKYSAILIGSGVAGVGGLFYVMDFVGGSWENSSTIQAFGWLALALVIFTVWKPAFAIVGAILFGFLYICPNYIVGVSFTQMAALKMLPYVVTIIVLVVTSIIGKKSVLPPASLGVNYYREER